MAYKVKQSKEKQEGTYLQVGLWKMKNGKAKFIEQGYYGNPTSEDFKSAEEHLKEREKLKKHIYKFNKI